jgi:signal peptidase I
MFLNRIYMKKKFTVQFYITAILVVVLVVFFFKDLYIKDNTTKEGDNIIVKFDSIQNLPKRSYDYFSYYIEGEKISTCNRGPKDFFKFRDRKLLPNKFYKAKKNKNDPMTIIVNQEEQVTDTLAILAAGFSKNDIK